MFGSSGSSVSLALPFLGCFLGFTKLRTCRPETSKGQLARTISFIMMAILALYGFVVATVVDKNYQQAGKLGVHPERASLAAGLLNGLSCGAAAFGIGWYACAAVQSCDMQPRLFVAHVLILIYIEAFGLYGLILSIVCMTKAAAEGADLPPHAAIPVASVGSSAMLGGIFGSVASGIAIMQIGVERPDLVMKCIMPVVFNGVTGIYGLINTVVDYEPWPPTGNDSIVGIFYILSSVGLSYFGYHGVKAVAQEPNSFISMIMKLIMSQSIGLMGLIVGLVLHGSAVQSKTINAAALHELSSDVEGSPSFQPLVLLSRGFGPHTWLPAAALCLLLLPLVLVIARRPRHVDSPPLLG
eukprot:TRINITY_DN48588_c0_g1_i1.p1 TRINITY_DN48588_c0_g1~~TRINITY_DN48588_c0_g1_i1.p1  ORF type:complete len:355 (+),score=66.99 TRINITY_DN48588_c0_g1_i1:95-1159(+)